MMGHSDPSGRLVPRVRRLIYFSSVPFASYAQRPHFMVDAFAEGGFGSVLWVDPYPTRFPAWTDLVRIGSKNEAAPCPVITFEHSARQFVPPMARLMPGTIPSL